LVLEPNHTMAGIGTSSAKFEVMKFNGSNNFGLWQRRVKDLLLQQGMVKSLYKTKIEGSRGESGGNYLALFER
jgi:hypothetical protein